MYAKISWLGTKLHWSVALLAVILVALALTINASRAAPQQTITIVSSKWQYEVGEDQVSVGTEIKNTSGQYLKDVAVQVTLLASPGWEIKQVTRSPQKTYLAPGESTFFWDIIYDDEAFLTDSVKFVAFGDSSSASEYPYLSDPAPSYLHSDVDGGRITYFGEFVNLTQQSWQADCKLCDALDLVAAYYQNGQLVEWESLAAAPWGHLPPGGKLAFRSSFDRVPDGSVKLFRKAEPLPPGKYPTTWAVENFTWELVDGAFGGKAIDISARIGNTSDVAANPDVWFVAYDNSGRWIGWASCSIFEDIEPGSFRDCSEELLGIYMHVGEPEDVRNVEALVASAETTSKPLPTPEPLLGFLPLVLDRFDGSIVRPTNTPSPATSTPTATSLPPSPTATPTAVPTNSPTSTPGSTSTPTATPSATGVQVLNNHSHYVDSIDYLHVVGEIENNTLDDLRFVRIAANFFNAQGGLVKTGFTYTYLDNLHANDKTCFKILVEEPENWATYEFEEPTYWTDGDAPLDLAVFNDSGSYDSRFGWYEIIGQVRNDEDFMVESVSPVATLYGSDGTALGCDFTFVNSTDLAANQTSSFEITATGRDFSNVTSYRLQADGSPQLYARWLAEQQRTQD